MGCDVVESRDMAEDIRADAAECTDDGHLRFEVPAHHGSESNGKFAVGNEETLTFSIFDPSGDQERPDFSRWATLNGPDGPVDYFLHPSSQLAWAVPWTDRVEADHQGIELETVVKIRGYPSNADGSSFAMLHDGTDAHLYFMSEDKSRVLGGALTQGRFRYSEDLSFDIDDGSAPGDIDLERGWAMTNDGSRSYLYSHAEDVDGLYRFVLSEDHSELEDNDSGEEMEPSYSFVYDGEVDVDISTGESFEDFSMFNEGTTTFISVHGEVTPSVCNAEDAPEAEPEVEPEAPVCGPTNLATCIWVELKPEEDCRELYEPCQPNTCDQSGVSVCMLFGNGPEYCADLFGC